MKNKKKLKPYQLDPAKLYACIPSSAHAFIESLKALESAEASADAFKPKIQQKNRTAILEFSGFMMRDAGWLRYYGYNDILTFCAALEEIRTDDDIEKVIIFANTPGGEAVSAEILQKTLSKLAAEKPVHVHVDEMLASAGVYAFTAATTITANPAATLGAIGTYWDSFEYSKQLEALGITYVRIASSPLKGTPNSMEAMSDETKAFMQTWVDDFQALFIKALTENRGFSEKEAKALSTGDIYLAQKALDKGLIDGLTTSDAILNGEWKNKKKGASMTLEELKTKHPELYAQIVNDAKAKGSINSLKDLEETYPDLVAQIKAAAQEGIKKASSAQEGNTNLEKTVAKLSADLEAEKQARVSEKRENIALQAINAKSIPDDAWPQVEGIDLKASYHARVKAAALHAESDEEAIKQAEAIVAEQVALMPKKSVKTEASKRPDASAFKKSVTTEDPLNSEAEPKQNTDAFASVLASTGLN